MGTRLPNRLQQTTLILLRTLIGWHFAWEGFIKLWWPSWSRGGWPLARWSAAGYLQGATGPFADFFRGLGKVSSIYTLKKIDGGKTHRPWIDNKGWLTPAFREQLCLVVTINNHCVE